MKKIFSLKKTVHLLLFGYNSILFIFISLLFQACSSPTNMLSPNRETSAGIMVDKCGMLCYRVMFDGKEVISPSPMGIIVNKDTLGNHVSLQLVEKTVINESYTTRGFHTVAVNHATQYTYNVQHSKGSFSVQFRMYDDGVAFRYIVPGNGDRMVNGELTTFKAPQNTPVWFFERKNDWKLKTYAGEWLRTLSDSLCTISPTGPVQGPILLYELPHGKYMGITEAALYRYSGMRLEAKQDASLQANFTEKNGFVVPGEIVTPWRVIMLADDLNELVNSDIISNLNPAPDAKLFADQSWIKPGRSVWSFWSSWGKPYYMTLPYEKHLIDRAVEINYEYTLLDEGWDNWENKWKDLEEICDYARQKNKGVFVWKHCSKILHPEDNYRQMRIFLDSIKNAGAVGVKIDYMNGESKELIDFEIKALELCAERKMMVDFHGCHQPTGESRTYPNEITREGIRGLELNLMREPIPGRHDVALVFTRCILNSADYTPVGFSNSALTSWPHQLATAFAFTSPLIVIAENPDTLFTNPTTAKVLPLMEALPTVWDETIVLPESSVSETAVLARRSGNDWYLAILNGDKSKELTITTNFLKEGKWSLFVAKDDAEKQKNILTERRTVDAGESLNIHLNSNGGYVAQFLKK